MIEVLLFGVALALPVGGVVGTIVGRKTAPDVKTITVEADPKKFRCPYCKVEVNGYTELDRINHTACIGMAEADLEKIKKDAEEAAAKSDGKYRVVINQVRQKTKPNNPYLWDQDYDTDVWVRYNWNVYAPGGALVDGGYEAYKDDAEEKAEAIIELDKEKHTVYEVA